MNPDGDQLIINYIKEKYGVNSVIKEKHEEPEMVSSEVNYILYSKDNEDVLFTVTVDYAGDEPKIKDTYNQAVETNKEYQKLKKVIPAIKKIGFKGRSSAEIRVDYKSQKVGNGWRNYISLYLKTDSPINIRTFEEKELVRFYKLVKIIQDSGAAIDHVGVEDNQEMTETTTIVIKMNQLKDVKSTDEFLFQLKKSNWELASFYANKKWEDEAKKVENERFKFGAQYEDYWFNCLVQNEKGECTSILATVTYQNGGLKQSNPHLKEDLNKIFAFFENTMKPKPTVELSLQESGDSGEMVRFTQAELKQFKSTDDLIKGLFKK
jgi:hypothetical protein